MQQAKAVETSKRKFSEQTYLGSELSLIIQGFLAEIVKVKKNHPKGNDKSLKRTHADDLLSFLAWGLEKVHADILPAFDRGNQKPKMPGPLDLLGYGIKYAFNKDLFYTREAKVFIDIHKLLKNSLKVISVEVDLDRLYNILESCDQNELFTKAKESAEESAKEIQRESFDRLFAHIKKVIKGAKLNYNAHDSIWDQFFSHLEKEAIKAGAALNSEQFSLLFSEIRKVLKKGFTVTSVTVNRDELCELLDNKKADLFKGAEKIPGQSLENFFTYVKQVVREMEFFNAPGVSVPVLFLYLLEEEAFKVGTPFENAAFSFEHFHPMIFDLVVGFTRIVVGMSSEVKEVIPFLHPHGLVAYLEPIGKYTKLLEKFEVDEFTFDLENPKQTPAGPEDAELKYIVSCGGKTVSVDIQKKYEQYYSFGYSFMLGLIAAHYRKFSENVGVKGSVDALLVHAQQHYQHKSEHKGVQSKNARASLLQEFVAEELVRSESYLKGIPAPAPRIDGLTGLDLIAALNDEIINAGKRAFLHRQWVGIRKGFYKNDFVAYVENSLKLEKQKTKDQTKGYDITYLYAPLPDEILALVEGKVQIVPIRSRLVGLINQKLGELNYNPKDLERLIADRKRAVSDWARQEKINRSVQMKQFLDGAAEKKTSLSKLVDEINKKVVDSSDSASLRAAIESCKADKLKLDEFDKFLIGFVNNQNALKHLPGEVDEFAIDLVRNQNNLKKSPDDESSYADMEQGFINIADSLTELAEEFNTLLKSASARLGEIQAKLEGDLVLALQKEREKAEAEAEYARKMRELNVPTMEARLSECTQRRAELADQKYVLSENLASTKGKLESAGCVGLEFREDNAQIYQHEREKLESEKQKLVAEALDIILKEVREDVPDMQSALVNIQLLEPCFEAAFQCLSKRMTSPHPLQTKLDNLLRVKEILDADKERNVIPFEKIGRLYAGSKQTPFEGFLTLVCDQFGYDRQDRDKWELYVGRESKKRWSLKKDEQKAYLLSFYEELGKQIPALSDAIKRKNDADKMSQEQLGDLHGFLQANKKLRDIVDSKSELHDLELKIKVIDTEDAELRAELLVLNPCICLLKNMQTLSNKVEAFSSRREKFLADATLYKEVENITAAIQALENELKAFLILIQTQPDNEKNLTVHANIKALLNSNAKKFNDSITDKFSSEEDYIRDLRGDFSSFKSKSNSFSDNSKLYEEAVNLQARQHDFKISLERLQGPIDPFDNPNEYQEVFNRIKRSFAALDGQISADIAEKFNQTKKVFADWLADCQQENAAVAAFLEALPENDLSTHLDAVSQQLQVCSESMAHMQARQADADKILNNIKILKNTEMNNEVFSLNHRLRGSIAEMPKQKDSLLRIKMLVQLSCKLDVYLNESESINPDKSIAFSQYVVELKRNMVDAAKSGDFQALKAKVISGIGCYTSDQTQQFLNQILVKIFDFQRTGSDQDNEAIPNDLHTQACDHLNNIGNTLARRKLRKIYDNIDQFQADAADILKTEDTAVVKELAQRLRADVDRFVLKHQPGVSISRDDYERFRDTFSARLYSQKVIVNQYRPLISIVGSVFLMVITLGILPLYNLGVGKSAFYFDDKLRMRKEVGVMGRLVWKEEKFLPAADPSRGPGR